MRELREFILALPKCRWPWVRGQEATLSDAHYANTALGVELPVAI